MTSYFLIPQMSPKPLRLGICPDVAFTGSFPDTVFGKYVRQEMGKNMPPKCGISPPSPVLTRKYCPGCHVRFVKNKRLDCEIKVYF